MEMKSMEISKEEMQKKMEEMQVAPMDGSEGPKYPWGLKVCLDTESIAKLGLSQLPDVGTKMKLMATVEVCEVGAYQKQDGKEEKRLELQITEMGLGSGEEEVSAADKIYGKV